MKLIGPHLFLFALPLLAACGSVTTASSELALACQHLFDQRASHDQRCTGITTAPEQASIDSCIGIATAPGSRLLVADIEACASALGGACSPDGTHPDCAGFGGDLLYPNHDKKGEGLPGESCIAQLQCESGYCSAGYGACGQCQRARDLGEICTPPDDVCVRGMCSEGTCQLPGAKEGEACIDYGGGDCQETLFCKASDPSTIEGVCAPRAGAGASCTSSDGCNPELHCKAQVCTPLLPDGASCGKLDVCQSTCLDGVCGKMKAGLTEGQDCSAGYCAPGLGCKDQVCTAPTHAPEGGACVSNDASGPVCGSGFLCNRDCDSAGACASSGTCARAPGPGEPCMNVYQCAAGAVCHGFNPGANEQGTCVKLGLEGEPCPCAEQLACHDDQCLPFGAALCH